MAFWGTNQQMENEIARLNHALRASETEKQDLNAQCAILQYQLQDQQSFNQWYATQHIEYLNLCGKQNTTIYLQNRIHELNGIVQSKDSTIGEQEVKLQACDKTIDEYKLESMMLQTDSDRLSKITSYVCNLHLTDPTAKAAIQHIVHLAVGPPSEDTFSTEVLSYGSTHATYNSDTDYFGFMEEGAYRDLEGEPLIAVEAEATATEAQKPGCSYRQQY